MYSLISWNTFKTKPDENSYILFAVKNKDDSWTISQAMSVKKGNEHFLIFNNVHHIEVKEIKEDCLWINTQAITIAKKKMQ